MFVPGACIHMKTPKTLFKYVRTADAAINILRGRFKFTPPADLNDPFDLFPFVDEEEIFQSLEDQRRHGISEYEFNFLKLQAKFLSRLDIDFPAPVPDSIEEYGKIIQNDAYNSPYITDFYQKIANCIRSKVGVMSLSSRSDSLPMWAHYANLAQGFIVVLRDLSDIYNDETTGILDILKPVRYEKKPVGMSFNPSTQDRLFFSKHEDWAYEQEWRVLTDLKSCIPGNSLSLKVFNPIHVEGIICGWRSPKEDVLRVSSEAESLPHKPNMMQARMVDGKFSHEHYGKSHTHSCSLCLDRDTN